MAGAFDMARESFQCSNCSIDSAFEEKGKEKGMGKETSRCSNCSIDPAFEEKGMGKEEMGQLVLEEGVVAVAAYTLMPRLEVLKSWSLVSPAVTESRHVENSRVWALDMRAKEKVVELSPLLHKGLLVVEGSKHRG